MGGKKCGSTVTIYKITIGRMLWILLLTGGRQVLDYQNIKNILDYMLLLYYLFSFGNISAHFFEFGSLVFAIYWFVFHVKFSCKFLFMGKFDEDW